MAASKRPVAPPENGSFPTFAEFYRAINDRQPFPWQARLAEEVARTETWRPVGAQTGLGKTVCLDIAVWWLASQAGRATAERTAPTRIWWVVNRRLLVDSTAQHAEELAGLLGGATSQLDDRAQQVVAAVGNRLRSLSVAPSAKPLQVIRLRGGLASHTPKDPSSPAIILCTLPMYASRLLFRGYGSKLRSIDAAMAGTDSLVLLDEAHLAPYLKKLLPALAECTPGARSPLAEARSQARLVPLTATGDQADGEPFLLNDDDEANPVVRQRLDATKRLQVREGAGDGVRSLADAAQDLLQQAPVPSSCLVFANTPKTARAVFDLLMKQYDGKADLLLLTGLMREREAERIRRRILDPRQGFPATRDASEPRARHFIVVATQTLEVGADVDSEYLVTETCGVRALTQRLGRLNRLGQHGRSRAIYVHVPPKVAKRSKKPNGATWPVYGKEPAAVWQRLRDALADDGTVDLAPRHIARVLGPPPPEEASSTPEVLPGLLWEWIKTTTPPEGEAPVEPYFSGIEGPSYAVSLIWRVHIPEDDERLWPRATDGEAIDVPLQDVRAALKEEEVQRLATDGVTVETVSADQLWPGDRVVLSAQRGLMDEFGWNPDADKPVFDASLAGNGLPLDSQALEHLCDVRLKRQIDAASGLADDEEIDQAAQQEAASEVLEAIQAAATPAGWDDDEWTDFVDTLASRVVQARREVPRLRVENPQQEPWNIELDETSISWGAEAVELEAHGVAVGGRARDIATSIGLPPHLCEVIEAAGRAHDIGKADERFQRWLDPEGKRGTLVAKSSTPRHRWEATRVASGWPRGGRHEALSAWLVAAWLERVPAWGDWLPQLSAEEQQMARELLLHLVISHHGKGRPLVRPVADDTLAEVCGQVEGVAVRVPANLSRTDWNQPARFKRLNDHFGPWGLALLEAILIRADHAVSAGTNVDLDPL